MTNPNDPNDTDSEAPLWRKARQGDEDAYSQLHVLHQSLVCMELRRYCPDLGCADLEDLEQEVWITAWKALPRFEGRSTFATWLGGITKNVRRAWLRHRRGDETMRLRFRNANGEDAANANGHNGADHVNLHAAIRRLPQSEHQVIVLRYFEQLVDAEIAGRLHLPLGTVKGRLRSGLSHLRGYLS